jgi:hypothetical protein
MILSDLTAFGGEVPHPEGGISGSPMAGYPLREKGGRGLFDVFSPGFSERRVSVSSPETL